MNVSLPSRQSCRNRIWIILLSMVFVGAHQASVQAGACCLGSGTCITTVNLTDCNAVNGEFLGKGSICADVDCNGACCLADATCSLGSADACNPGVFQGAGSSCETHCAGPLGTRFTYQGQLKEQGVPLTGMIDLEASLWTAAVGGDQVESTVPLFGVTVTNGLFTVQLDFGAPAFDGDARFLELAIRSPNDPSDMLGFTTLAPRQAVSAAPYALQTRGLFVDETSHVGIGTTSPTVNLHVVGEGNFAASLLVENPDGSDALQVLESSIAIGERSSGAAITLGANGSNQTIAIGMSHPSGGFTVLHAGFSGVQIFQNLGIGGVEPTVALEVADSASTVAIFNRFSNDGTIVEFQQQAVTEGSISVSGSTVSYNGFTGSHLGWTREAIERGTLVRMTGENRRMHDSPGSEPVYGIEPTQQANDSSCLGGYLAPHDAPGVSNSHLVMAVGNGELWVVQRGESIAPGDLLISADVAGTAMKDDAARFDTAYVIARAAEPVDWDGVERDASGLKRKRISVLFDPFVRSSAPSPKLVETIEDFRRTLQDNEAEIAAQKDQIDDLSARLKRVEKQLAPRTLAQLAE